jgi:hypothetical protein
MWDNGRKEACCEIRRYLCLAQIPYHYLDAETWEERMGRQTMNRLYVGRFLSA